MMLNDNLPADAQILPFYLANGSDNDALIRGRMASVGRAASSILARHGYPKIVAILQAEALALAACLSSTLKFDGVFTLQAKGDGLVRTLFADITETGALRGYAVLDHDRAAFQPAAKELDPVGPVRLGNIMGDGYIAFTVDDGISNGRYQGIVELDDQQLSDAAMRWYENSEQLNTVLFCAAAEGPDGWQAVALMLQRIAVESGKGDAMDWSDTVTQSKSDDAWHTAKTLMGSVTRDELLDPAISPENMVFRLFNTMAPHIAPARPVADQCRCNVEKIESVLQQLSLDEVEDLADGDGNLTITCEFCKTERAYHKDAIPSV
jgi:molecular chaperone Hsp33